MIPGSQPHQIGRNNWPLSDRNCWVSLLCDHLRLLHGALATSLKNSLLSVLHLCFLVLSHHHQCCLLSSWLTKLTAPPKVASPAATGLPRKSAHPALAVKTRLLGGNSNTKCSITFVNIAVAISASAGGREKRFGTETAIFAPSPEAGGVLDFFRQFLGV